MKSRKQHGQPETRSMPAARQISFYAVLLIGLATVGFAIYSLLNSRTNPQWLILAFLTLVAGSYGIKLPAIKPRIYIGGSLLFASILIFGTPAGVVSAALLGLAGSIETRKQPRMMRRALFNAAALAPSAQVAGMLYSHLSPAGSLLHRFNAELLDMLMPLSALAFAYHVTSSVSNAFVVAQEKNEAFWEVWGNGFLRALIANFAGVSAAALICIIAGTKAPKALGILVPVGSALYFTYRFYLKKFNETHSLAYYDSLTGLPNRVLFKDKLEEALAWSEQQKRMLAVMFLDLDHFKETNDTFGHNTGDLLLKSVAARLTGNVRSSDSERYLVQDEQDIIIGRFGGDEFTILMKAISHPDDAVRIARRFRSLLSDPYSLGGHEVETTATIGISIYPFDGTNAEALLKKADVALYHAKSSRRGSYQLYSQSLTQRSSDRAALERQLREALERKEFEILYQPQIDATSGKILAAEALLRWHHPSRGLVRAADFIALAEETGLIKPMGEWVLQTVCAQIQAWRRDGTKAVPVSINLSPLQFRQPNLAQSFARALKSSGLEPAWIQIELTESSLAENEQETQDMLDRLRKIGIGVSVDDFGTGHFSLSRLKGFQLNALKIDTSFVNDCHKNPGSQTVIEAIIALAGIYGFSVEAEGVETEQQLEFLLSRGIIKAQGSYFLKPVSAIELAEYLQSNKGFNSAGKKEVIAARSPIHEDANAAGYRPVSL